MLVCLLQEEWISISRCHVRLRMPKECMIFIFVLRERKGRNFSIWIIGNLNSPCYRNRVVYVDVDFLNCKKKNCKCLIFNAVMLSCYRGKDRCNIGNERCN